MANPRTIKIDDVEYIRVTDLPPPDGELKIVVLDRGFVYIGRYKLENDFVVIRDALNIRVWGTTKGLGELITGPTNKTILDKTGTVRAPLRALIATIDVAPEGWVRAGYF